MNRRFLLSLFMTIGLLTLVTPIIAAEKSGKSHHPNIVVILADDLGYGDLSCYGAEDLKSPNIDALAEAGMRFSTAYASCTVCSPTRASLLTGKYPELAGVPGVMLGRTPRVAWR